MVGEGVRRRRDEVDESEVGKEEQVVEVGGGLLGGGRGLRRRGRGRAFGSDGGLGRRLARACGDGVWCRAQGSRERAT